jgi:hypothetical protein
MVVLDFTSISPNVICEEIKKVQSIDTHSPIFIAKAVSSIIIIWMIVFTT